jgi:hypothetical protein
MPARRASHTPTPHGSAAQLQRNWMSQFLRDHTLVFGTSAGVEILRPQLTDDLRVIST